MDGIESMSNVRLLSAYTLALEGATGSVPDVMRAEILRRMDSTGTTNRDDIEVEPSEHQR